MSAKQQSQEKKKTTKKRRPNAAYYYERHFGRNMIRRALRMVRRERSYQRWLSRHEQAHGCTVDAAKLKARLDRAVTAARACAERWSVLGRFNVELERAL